ncbi:MAG: tryptophan 2,3-dioxygenase family protein [Planctomycetota bacterium]
MTAAKPTYYWDYIQVDALLKLQGGLEGDDKAISGEEVMFITVHQVFELWFKVILRELGTIRDRFKGQVLENADMLDVVTRLERCTTILRVGNQHWEVMETLPPREYLKPGQTHACRVSRVRSSDKWRSCSASRNRTGYSLRSRRQPPAALRGQGVVETEASRRVAHQMADMPTLKQVVADWLERTPIGGATHHAGSHREFIEQYLAAHSKGARSEPGAREAGRGRRGDGGQFGGALRQGTRQRARVPVPEGRTPSEDPRGA